MTRRTTRPALVTFFVLALVGCAGLQESSVRLPGESSTTMTSRGATPQQLSMVSPDGAQATGAGLVMDQDVNGVRTASDLPVGTSAYIALGTGSSVSWVSDKQFQLASARLETTDVGFVIEIEGLSSDPSAAMEAFVSAREQLTAITEQNAQTQRQQIEATASILQSALDAAAAIASYGLSEAVPDVDVPDVPAPDEDDDDG